MGQLPAAPGPRQRVSKLLDAGDLEGVLGAVEDIVETVFNEPLNTAEIFGDAFLDAACQKVGSLRLAVLAAVETPPEPGNRPDELVFVASRLQSSGGHTAVLADIARRSGKPVRIFLTGVGGPTDLAGIGHIFGGIDDLAFEKAPRGRRLKKLEWLQRRLRQVAPAQVWLFNHHRDSIAVAAVQPGQGYELKYLHHGDHHLCLGVFLGYGEHFDPHPMGFYNCRYVLQNPDNKYLPLVAPDPGPRVTGSTVADAPLVTATAAGKNKIEHAYWPDYADVVAALVRQTRGTHIHMGRLSLAYRWRIRRALRAVGASASAFKYIPHVKSVAQSMDEFRVDLYLSSFPYAGARTLVEVMASGTPTAAHNHSGKRFLGAIDMLPPGSCLWAQPSDLLEFVAMQSRASLQKRGQEARRHYEAYHSPERLEEALAGVSAIQNIPLSGFVHAPDLLSQALERARQTTLTMCMAKWARRKARQLVALLS